MKACAITKHSRQMLYLHYQRCKEIILFLRDMNLIFSCSTTNQVYFSVIKKNNGFLVQQQLEKLNKA